MEPASALRVTGTAHGTEKEIGGDAARRQTIAMTERPVRAPGRSVAYLQTSTSRGPSPPHSSDSSSSSGNDDDEDDNQEGSGGMSLQMKADTLGYQLPSADSEIRRIEEMQRTLHEGTVKQARTRLAEGTRTSLADWLDRHPDVTLRELNLAANDKPISSISVEDAMGMGRYVMRGDLQMWLDRVEKMRSEARFEAGEWDSDDEREVDDTIGAQVQRVVNRDKERKQRVAAQATLEIAQMLSVIADREFTIDNSGVFDESEQLLTLSEYVSDWYSHFLKHGHPQPKKEETAEEAEQRENEKAIHRMQLEVGLAAAAKGSDILLTGPQLNQVLEAYYTQEQPPDVQQRERNRLGRALTEALSREEGKIATLRRRNKVLTDEVDEFKRTVHLQQDRLAAIEASTPSELRDPEAVEQMNDLTRTVVETLARKRIRDAEDLVRKLQVEREMLTTERKSLVESRNELLNRVIDLENELDEVRLQWKRHLKLQEEEAAEQRRRYGGEKDRTEHYFSVMGATMRGSAVALARMLHDNVCQEQVISQLRLKAGIEAKPGESRAYIRDAFETGLQWATAMAPSAVTEGARVAIQELAVTCQQNLRERNLMELTDEFGDVVSMDEMTPLEGSPRKLMSAPSGSDIMSGGMAVASPRSARTSYTFDGTEGDSTLQRIATRATMSKADFNEADENSAAGGPTTALQLSDEELQRVAKSQIDPERQLVDALARRLDAAVAEARAKFRELRYMRSTVRYITHCVDAMLAGTYSDQVHGLRKFPPVTNTSADAEVVETEADTTFPPQEAVDPDSDYAYAWTQEAKLLENMFLELRTAFWERHSTAVSKEKDEALLGSLDAVESKHKRPSAAGGGLQSPLAVSTEGDSVVAPQGAAVKRTAHDNATMAHMNKRAAATGTTSTTNANRNRGTSFARSKQLPPPESPPANAGRPQQQKKRSVSGDPLPSSENSNTTTPMAAESPQGALTHEKTAKLMQQLSSMPTPSLLDHHISGALKIEPGTTMEKDPAVILGTTHGTTQAAQALKEIQKREREKRAEAAGVGDPEVRVGRERLASLRQPDLSGSFDRAKRRSTVMSNSASASLLSSPTNAGK